jgi:hypothetical protein
MGFITGNYGGQQTTQQPLYSNPLASVLGGAASGAGLSMFLGPKGAGLT